MSKQSIHKRRTLVAQCHGLGFNAKLSRPRGASNSLLGRRVKPSTLGWMRRQLCKRHAIPAA